MIYLDNSMVARPSERAVAQMIPFLTEMWGSAMSPHRMGQELHPAIREAYRELYHLIDADEKDTILFTSCGAEAVNQVFWSTYLSTTPEGKNQYIIANTDEAPAMMSLSRLEQMECVGKHVKPNEHGIVTVDAIADAITPRTALISLSWANGLTGTIQPVIEIGKLCQERGILFHLDATHVLGKLHFDLKELGASFISWNGDQIHAPQGTGALWIKHGTDFAPFIVGGLEQAGKRAGSLNVAGLIALGQASREALEARDLLGTEVARLRNHLEEEILQKVPDAEIFFRDQERLPHCTTIGFPGVANEALLFLLNQNKVCASIGGGSFQQVGLLLKAAGVDPFLAQSAISFSLSRETTQGQIEEAAAIIADCVKKLRHLSGKLVEEA